MNVDPDHFLRTLWVGLIASFLWGAVVALASKIDIKHAIPASPWITERLQ